MKRTISANIGGLLFNIEDDACDRLEQYLHELENTFTPDIKSETINDIENRLAEIFNELTNNRKQVLSIAHIENAIATIGINNFNNTHTGTYPNNKKFYQYNTTRKLNRIKQGKVIAGVCNGLAQYFNIDPIIVRLLFLVASFGFGFGFLIYLVLWIIVPKK